MTRGCFHAHTRRQDNISIIDSLPCIVIHLYTEFFNIRQKERRRTRNTDIRALEKESLQDMGQLVDQMGADFIILRHPMAGAPRLLADCVNASVVNAGDGFNENPGQSLLDLLTIKEQKGGFEGLKVAIVGDLRRQFVGELCPCTGFIKQYNDRFSLQMRRFFILWAEKTALFTGRADAPCQNTGLSAPRYGGVYGV